MHRDEPIEAVGEIADGRALRHERAAVALTPELDRAAVAGGAYRDLVPGLSDGLEHLEPFERVHRVEENSENRINTPALSPTRMTASETTTTA